MELESQAIKIRNLNQNNSKARRVYEIFKLNPDKVFDIRGMTKLFNETYCDNSGTQPISTIITRLYAKNKLIRTPTQLNSGHSYSFRNEEKIGEVYRNYLLPYNFDDKEEILGMITQNSFEKLKTDCNLNLTDLERFDFFRKYGLAHFSNPDVIKFLVTNLGFLLCDGHVKQDLEQARYFFNQEDDAISFRNYFNQIFADVNLSLNYRSSCYRVGICNKGFVGLINYLGVPMGNKIFKPFLVPNWIYQGSEQLKREFLSVIYGCEGSKPQDNRWRIQFVLSKSKLHVPNLLEFLNQIRAMLANFGTTSSHIQLRKQPGREFCGRFYIKGKDNLLKFYNIIGFKYASEKQEVLEAILKKDSIIK